MKAKELAEKLLEHPEFEVTFSFHIPDGRGLTKSITFYNVDICDIGYSDKIISLQGDE